MLSNRRLFASAALAVVLLGAGVWLVVSKLASPPAAGPERTASRPLPALNGTFAWLNGRLEPDSLEGRPVALVFWADTDARALLALPRVESWYEAYARYGVRVIGVHEPEFGFAADFTVPSRAVQRLGLRFPIVLDPEYQIRASVGPPADRGGILVADASGRVVLQGGFDRLDEADRAIRREIRLLHPELDIPDDPAAGSPSTGIPAPREIRLGAGQVKAGPLASVVPGRSLPYAALFRYEEEGANFIPFPVGRWTQVAEGLIADAGGAAQFVALRTTGGMVAAVLSPRVARSSKVWVLSGDDWLSDDERGADVQVDDRGATYLEVKEPRLYWIARAPRAFVLRLSPEEPGVTFHAFTVVPSPGGAASR